MTLAYFFLKMGGEKPPTSKPLLKINYGIFTYTYHKNQPFRLVNTTNPMDGMGLFSCVFCQANGDGPAKLTQKKALKLDDGNPSSESTFCKCVYIICEL